MWDFVKSFAKVNADNVHHPALINLLVDLLKKL